MAIRENVFLALMTYGYKKECIFNIDDVCHIGHMTLKLVILLVHPNQSRFNHKYQKPRTDKADQLHKVRSVVDNMRANCMQLCQSGALLAHLTSRVDDQSERPLFVQVCKCCYSNINKINILLQLRQYNRMKLVG